MDCASFFTERVGHFEEERKLITRYKLLITPSKAEIHHLSWETSQQQEHAELAAQEVVKLGTEIEIAQKELAVKREELVDLKEAQSARQSQLSRLSQLAQPIETDVTYLFDEKPLRGGGMGLIESVPKENLAPTQLAQKQTKTGDMLQLEARLHEITRIAYTKFAEFDTTFINANIKSRNCEETVNEKIEVAITRAADLINEIDKLDKQSFFSVSELLNLRLNIMIAQRMEVEELEKLTKEKNYFLLKEHELKEQLEEEMHQMKARLKYELASCTKELQKQLDIIKRKRDKVNNSMKNEALLDKHLKRPGALSPGATANAAAAGANKLDRAVAVLKKKKEFDRLEKKKKEKEELEDRLAYTKERYHRLKEHFRLEMEDYQTQSV